MGLARTERKTKWNQKTYDDIRIRVPKGMLEQLKRYAEQRGESLNGLIIRLLEAETKLMLRRTAATDAAAAETEESRLAGCADCDFTVE